MRHIIPISGKDSLCTALVQRARRSDFLYEYLFCDVRMELPETYRWLEQVEKTLGIKVVRVGRSLEEVIAEIGMLPSHSMRFCTRLGKVSPLQEYVGKDEAVQYLGIRADEQQRVRIPSSPTNIVDRYPLVELGITLPMVYAILEKQFLLPPDFFWKRLFDVVHDKVSTFPNFFREEMKGFMEGCKPWTRSHLFSWRSRSNCFMCFYQRLYEWVGLLEHHPDLFEQAEKLEQDYGAESFTFVKDWPLARIRRNAEEIFNRRVGSVYQAIMDRSLRVQGEEADMLAMTSCGTYCGK